VTGANSIAPFEPFPRDTSLFSSVIF